MDPNNPYQPSAQPGQPMPSGFEQIPAADLKRVEAVVKDAGQFWLAILLCFLCSALGAIIIGPWYLARLVQWNSLSKEYPMLLDQNVPPDSLAKRFQSSRWKLIVGLCFGILVLGVVFLAVLASVGARAAGN